MDEILAKVILGINLLILAGKTVAAFMSHSHSIASTVLDSAMDLSSGLIIWITLKTVDKGETDPYHYPRGRRRQELLSVIIVSIVMGAANIVMIIRALQSIIVNDVCFFKTQMLRLRNRQDSQSLQFSHYCIFIVTNV